MLRPDQEAKFKVPDSILKKSQQRLEKIGRVADPSFETNSNSLISLQPSKEVVEVEKLKAKREERRLKRLVSESSVTSLSAAEKRAAFCIPAIEKFRLNYRAARLESALVNDSEILELSSAANKEVIPPIIPKIQVCVRKRPLLQKELDLNGCFDAITCSTDKFPSAIINLHEPKLRLDLTHDMTTHAFSYDHVFDENATNTDIYNQVLHSLIDSFLNGARASFYAFGQTGSGKTHTVFGSPSIDGLLGLVLAHVFQSGYTERNLYLSSSFVEIYGSKVFDLNASRKPVRLLEDLEGIIQLHGQKEVRVDRRDDLMELVAESLLQRTIGETEANQESSRSHAIFTLTLWNNDGSVYSKFSLVDLAGSERGIDAGNSQDKKSRSEGSGINKSLLALKECIRILHLKRSRPDIPGLHIPFRDSKLTQVLRESFIGKNSQTVMMCCVTPGSNCVEQTLNTLRYGDRVKEFSPQSLPLPPPQQHSKLSKKGSLPKLPVDESDLKEQEPIPATAEKDYTSIEQSRNKSEAIPSTTVDQEFDQEMIMQQHIQCMIQTSSLSKEERLIIAKATDPEYTKEQYLVDSINIIEKKMALYQDLKLKMESMKSNLV